MDSAVCSPTCPRSDAAGVAAACSSAIELDNAESGDDASSGNEPLRLETLRELVERCEGRDAEWWQALVVGAAIDVGDEYDQVLLRQFGSDDPERAWRTAVFVLDSRCRGPGTLTNHAAGEAAVLDEIELFRQRFAGEFSDEKETDMATATKNRAPALAAGRIKEPKETVEQVLRRALRLTAVCWRPHQVNGATDEQLHALLTQLWEEDRQAPQDATGRPYWVRGTPHPALWLDAAAASPGTKAPALIGDDLIVAVRRAADIPQPRELVDVVKNGKRHEVWAPKESNGNGKKPATDLSRGPTETKDDVLRRSFAYHETAWGRLRVQGASDAELLHEIGERYKQAPVHGGKGTRSYRTKGGPRPCIWFDATLDGPAPKTAPDLAGEALANRARMLLDIPARNKHSDHAAKKPEPAAAPSSGPLVIEQTLDIPIGLIDPSPYQTRDEPPPAWLDEIVESMRVDGQLTAGLVRRVADRYELLAGHTRRLGAQRLKWPTLRCDVTTCDDATACKLVYLENAKRRDLTAIERARGLEQVASEYTAAGRTVAEAAKDLGVSEGFFSNTRRLLRLPADFQARLLAGDLSIEQARTLATWADRPKVMEGFRKHAQNCGCSEGPIENDHFASCLRAGIQRASRTMRRNPYGESCNFAATKEDLQQLDLIEVKIPGRPTETRAFNVNYYKKRQAEANAKKKAKTTAGEKAAVEKPKGVQRDPYRFDPRRNRCWMGAYREALAHRVKKLSKGDRQTLARAAVCCGLPTSTTVAALLQMSDAEFETHCVQLIALELNKNLRSEYDQGNLALDELQAIAGIFGVDATPYFTAEKFLLETCGDADLRSIAKELDVDVDGMKREQIIIRLAKETWPRDEVPALFRLPMPKTKKAKR